MDNPAIFADLIRRGAIRLQRGLLLDRRTDPKPPGFDFDRVEGMLLGIAIGDALGNTTEGMLPRSRGEAFGEVRDYVARRHGDEPKGFPSDDTQMAFWTLEQLIDARGLVPAHLADRFSSSGRILGIGSTVRDFLRNLRSGMSWHQCGPESAGNGALMRIAPLVVPHLRAGGTGLWIDTALAAMMTHNEPASISACLAFVGMLWELLDMTAVPDSGWWAERYVALARDLEGDTEYSPRGGRFSGFRGSLWRFVEEKLRWADRERLSVLDACDAWYSGAFLLETVPSVLFVLMRYAGDPEEAIVRAVNDTRDNDTIAAIVGAAVGALHGRRGLPARWIDRLSGRTRDRDDRRVFELIRSAKATFWRN